MQAFAVIRQSADTSPDVALQISYVRLGSQSLTGTHRAYRVEADAEIIDALETDGACAVLLRVTNGELDEPWPAGLALLNGLMVQAGRDPFPDGITARQILAGLGIDPAGYNINAE